MQQHWLVKRNWYLYDSCPMRVKLDENLEKVRCLRFKIYTELR